MKIYYYVPDTNKPSWGLGMIYYHAFLLRRNGFDAIILHNKTPHKLTWIDLRVEVDYLSNKNLKITRQDYLIIPEFYADLPQLSKFECKKIVFVQNAFYIFDGLQRVESYEKLGVSELFYYMPHLAKILHSVSSLPIYQTPPFIAPYFYNDQRDDSRELKIILYPKFDNRDYIILKRLLSKHLESKNSLGLRALFSKRKNWKVVELKDQSHQQVAVSMKTSAIFICLNTTEAFNSSVPEAMAAGCINICYEGVGPADFLKNEVNAFVFPNNHIYELTRKVIEVVDRYEEIQPTLSLMRANAYTTANEYLMESLEEKLVDYFKARG